MSQLVHEVNRGDDPATHVLVIGAGAYPYLVPPADARECKDSTGLLALVQSRLGQLTAPPVSAVRFAEWMIERFNNPGKPLGSVALLASAEQQVVFTNPKTKKASAVPQATTTEVQNAFEDWFDRGKRNQQNLMIFFFCGHGIGEGFEHSLLLSDFGKNPLDLFENAIDLRRFWLGMDRCHAQEQCFFIDACRAPAEIAERAEIGGIALVSPLKTRTGTRVAPAISSTGMEQSAYAPPGDDEPTYFTRALLQGLNGMGAEDTRGEWRVSTESLLAGIRGPLQRQSDAGLPQRPGGFELASIDLHFLDAPPLASVVVECTPEPALRHALLRCVRREFETNVGPPAVKRWELALEMGEYLFRAEFPYGGPFSSTQVSKTIGTPRETLVPLRVRR